MTEPQHGGMKVKAVGRKAIEGVALDGPAQTIGMGTMHTQLMGTAGQRLQLHTIFPNKPKFCYPFLTLCIIYHLTWTIHHVCR